MTRVFIRARDLDASLSATVESGHALLIGRDPDPSRIDWSKLFAAPSARSPLRPRTESTHYRIETLTVQSGRTSANHLLILRDGEVTALCDLGSRNGSWMRLGPQRPMVVAGGPDVSIALAGTPPQESRLSRPRDAVWSQDEDFAAAVAQSVRTWFTEIDVAVQVAVQDSGSSSDLVLADGSVLALYAKTTLPICLSTLFESVSAYVHDQNTRFLQLKQRVSGMVAGSAAIRQILLRTAEAAASGRRTILLGPTGVGKELLARSYHGYSRRHAGPFVTVNCALLDKDLLYAQLFGARRGSFTSASTDIAGLIETADGGTLFLDELGEMSPDVQKALLRFLDSRGEYYRLGEPRARHADVQLVCASNAPLEDPAYRCGRFRDDLWYRLAASVIAVPPLCERPDDIRAYLQSRSLHGSALRVSECLSEAAMALVLKDPWPGNFRDLENFINRLPVVAQPRSIDRATCEQTIREGRPRSMNTPLTSNTTPPAAVSPPAAPLSELVGLREPQGRPSTRLRVDTAIPRNDALGWDRIAMTAIHAFLEDQGAEPAGWDQLHLLIERYLKPMFVAHTAGRIQPELGGRSINYSALARRLHVADGSTVKTHLCRFEERFAPLSAANLER